LGVCLFLLEKPEPKSTLDAINSKISSGYEEMKKGSLPADKKKE
jgi:hypothetical protein